MARSRNIKPGFFTNAELTGCSPMARLLFAGLWTISDKAGRLRDRPKQIKGELFPHDDCDVDTLLNELSSVEEPFINRYVVEGVAYIQVVNWEKHQSPHHTERDSDLPPFDNGYLTVRERSALNQESGINEEGIRNQESGIRNPKGNSQTFIPPTVAEVQNYCRERRNSVDAEAFVDFYTAKGWLVGKAKMKDWKAAVRTWEKNSRNGEPHTPRIATAADFE